MSHITEHIVDTHGGIDHWEDKGLLVRCKDCVFTKQTHVKNDWYDGEVTICTYNYAGPSVEPDDYCSHGSAR